MMLLLMNIQLYIIGQYYQNQSCTELNADSEYTNIVLVACVNRHSKSEKKTYIQNIYTYKTYKILDTKYHT